jgi:FkbM family methyltransferase
VRDSLRRARTWLRALGGTAVFETPDARFGSERFGSDYGGWELVTALLNQDSVVYSFGVGDDASFDIALVDRFGLTVHAFDPTPRVVSWVQAQRFPPQFKFQAFGIASQDGNISFFPPRNPSHISHSVLAEAGSSGPAITVPVKRLGTIMKELGHSRIDVLKMDIEGAEYPVLADIEQSGIRPRQILVEFHHRLPGVGATKTKEAIAALRRIGYALFWVSPSGEEFGFIRGERAPSA